MGINPSSKFSQFINSKLPKYEPIVFDAAIAQKLCNRIADIQLMLGETKPQVICFALEQEVNYYAPAYRRADEGENPIIPFRKSSETPYNEADGERILMNERRWASNQVNFIRCLLVEMHWLATLYLEVNKKEISQNGQQSCFSPF